MISVNKSTYHEKPNQKIPLSVREDACANMIAKIITFYCNEIRILTVNYICLIDRFRILGFGLELAFN